MECTQGVKKRQESKLVARFWTKKTEECGICLFVCFSQDGEMCGRSRFEKKIKNSVLHVKFEMPIRHLCRNTM